jgi:hypothetical protein
MMTFDRFRIALFASAHLVAFPLAGCAGTSDAGHPDASAEAEAPVPDGGACGALDATKPACLRGAPCSCDDVAGTEGTPICVDGAWACEPGYTRFEDCRGVPPGPSCEAGAARDAS